MFGSGWSISLGHIQHFLADPRPKTVSNWIEVAFGALVVVVQTVAHRLRLPSTTDLQQRSDRRQAAL